MIKTYHTDEAAFLKEYTAEPLNCDFTSLTKIRVDEEAKYQTIRGFGAAMTDSACCVLHRADADTRAAVMEQLFSEQGAALNQVRVSVGASDYSRDCFSYDEVPDDVKMEHFSIDHDKEYVLPVLMELNERYPGISYLSSTWSPPGWMKTGGQMAGGWFREKYIEAYAEYYIQFIRNYAKYGIRISALTPQNETETDQVSRMPACLLHPEYEMKLAQVLRKRLEEEGLDPEIWIVDHNYIHWNRAKWMLDDKACKDAVQGVAFHYYEGNASMLDHLHDCHPDVGFHITEGGPDLGADYEKLFCEFSVTITNALKNWCQTFITWNAVLDENGYPTLGPFTCAGLVTLDSRTNEITPSGHYKALVHYSRFIKQNARRIGSTLAWYGQDATYDLALPILHAAFENPDGSLVIVLTNTGRRDEIVLNVRGENYRIRLQEKSVCTVVVPAQEK